MDKIKKFWAHYKSYIFLVIIILLALKVFVPELDSLKESVQAIRNAQLDWIIFGQIVFFLGLPIVAYQFLVIAIKPLKYYLTFKVEMASLFVSKLFPSSLGTVALNFYYLTKKKHDNVQAATVMAVNGITSGIAYVFIIGFAVFFDKGNLTTPTSPTTTIDWALIIKIVVLAIVAAVASLAIKRVRQRVSAVIKQFAQTLKVYEHRKKDVVMATFLNFAGSLTSLIALWASAHALGVEITMAQSLVAYVLGNIVGGLVPTPGGIGAVEAGIYSGLVLIGVDTGQAFTITLIYRFLTYWVPIAPGYYYFWSLRKDVLKDFSLKRKDAAKLANS
ncbi:MAG: lysylphosphatidylglycerol synthase transmembrane domain-containing protein [Candidatus Saccharimonadales bacterium]